METNNKPAWLETLWNVNPRLAEAAEKDVARWQKLETSQDQALNLADVSGSCVDCHYSGNGAHGCNRLMDGVTPKINKSKGVECAHNGYVHYLPFSHDR